MRRRQKSNILNEHLALMSYICRIIRVHQSKSFLFYMNTELEFEKPLTEYDRLIWIKLAYYTRNFKVNKNTLKTEIKSFGLESPKGMNIEDILKTLQESKSICFIDPNKQEEVILAGDLYISSHDNLDLKNLANCVIKCDNSYKYQSLLINSYNKSMNQYYSELSNEIIKEKPSKRIGDISNKLFQHLVTHVAMVGDYFMSFWQSENKEINLSLFQRSKPISAPFDHRYLNTLTEIMCQGGSNNMIRNYILSFPMIVHIRGYCAFSVLISHMIDAQSSHFPDVYRKITLFLLEHFQDSSIYLITRPLSNIKKSIPTINRGSESYTTQLKIFLFDKDMTPTLLRFDLPHKGEHNLHINIQTPAGNSSLDHFFLEKFYPGIDDFFEFIHDQMLRETQNLFVWNDVDRDDDCKILNEMQNFLDYEKLCFRYIKDKFILNKISNPEEEDIIFELLGKYITLEKCNLN